MATVAAPAGPVVATCVAAPADADAVAIVPSPAGPGAAVVLDAPPDAAADVDAQADVVATPLQGPLTPAEAICPLLQLCPCCGAQRPVEDFVHLHRSRPYPTCASCRVRVLSLALCFLPSLTMCRGSMGWSMFLFSPGLARAVLALTIHGLRSGRDLTMLLLPQ